jgi:hypothetical protein
MLKCLAITPHSIGASTKALAYLRLGGKTAADLGKIMKHDLPFSSPCDIDSLPHEVCKENLYLLRV